MNINDFSLCLEFKIYFLCVQKWLLKISWKSCKLNKNIKIILASNSF